MRDASVLTRTSSATISMPMIENLYMKAHVNIATDDLTIIESEIVPIGSMISTNQLFQYPSVKSSIDQ